MAEMKLGQALNAFIDKSKLKKEVQAVRLTEAWESIMGKTISRYTDKIQVIDKTLHIHTSVAPLRQELMYQKPKIIERVNECLGEGSITEVVIK